MQSESSYISSFTLTIFHTRTRCLCGDKCRVLNANWISADVCNILFGTSDISFKHIFDSINPDFIRGINFGEFSVKAAKILTSCISERHINRINVTSRTDNSWKNWLTNNSNIVCTSIISECRESTYIHIFDPGNIVYRLFKIITFAGTPCDKCNNILKRITNPHILDISVTYECCDTKHMTSNLINRNRATYYNTLVKLCMLVLANNGVEANFIQPADLRPEYENLYICYENCEML